MKITFMSYNILHGENCLTGKTDHDAFADVIKKYNADIVGINESREGSDLDNAREIAKRLGYGYYYAGAINIGGDNFHGNALLSRFPIVSAENIGIPDPTQKKENIVYETRCILKAKVDVGKIINVLITHFGLNEDEQINAVKAVVENLDDDCILMGDFNTVPDDKKLNPIRTRLIDTADIIGKKVLSFPSYKPERKIDYIFADKSFKIVGADIPDVVVSDHRPHIAVVEI